jgi:hypothetical protein
MKVGGRVRSGDCSDRGVERGHHGWCRERSPLGIRHESWKRTSRAWPETALALKPRVMHGLLPGSLGHSLCGCHGATRRANAQQVSYIPVSFVDADGGRVPGAEVRSSLRLNFYVIGNLQRSYSNVRARSTSFLCGPCRWQPSALPLE